MTRRLPFPAKKGTASEVAFCLVLKRPLALVGPTWETKYQLSKENRAAAVAQFREDMMTQMGRKRQKSPLDPAIGEAEKSLTEDMALPPVRYLPLDDKTSARAIVECVIDFVLPGRYPRLRNSML